MKRVPKLGISRLMTAFAVFVAGATGVRADAVLDWNAISTKAIFDALRPGPSAILDFAVVAATFTMPCRLTTRALSPT